MTMKIKWNRSGLREIRYGDADRRVITFLENEVEKVADRANSAAQVDGAKYVTGSQAGRRRPQGRWRTSVVTANYAAMRDNAKHNTLTRALFNG